MQAWRGSVALSGFILLLGAGFADGVDVAAAKRAYEQKDYATALPALRVLAEQGDPDAQLTVGKMYMIGQGVTPDRDEAAKWFTAAASAGNADAQFFLGTMYLLPQKDVGEGLKWLRRSAEQGMQDAQYLLGKTYLQGTKDLSRDPVQGAMWLQLAAKDNKQFYQDERDAAEKRMTAEEIAKARALAAAWKPKPASKADGNSRP
jgi:TPR repeat protein